MLDVAWLHKFQSGKSPRGGKVWILEDSGAIGDKTVEIPKLT